MKIIDCEQGTPSWVEARLGVPTASRFDKIITPKELKLSTSADMLISTMIDEVRCGTFEDDIETHWMNRGSNLEDIAADDYAFRNDVDLRKVGFITTDDGLIGCSPDRLIVGENAALEIKNPCGKWHVHYMRHPEILFMKYRCQVQASLWITEFDYWELMCYHPYYEPVVVRCEPDDKFKAAIHKAMYGADGFLERYNRELAKITTITQSKECKERLSA
jgi:hypothetical protein